MKVIAFDQATKATGYAIYEDTNLVRYGVLLASGQNCFVRMNSMFTQIHQLLSIEIPELVSIEGTQFQQNYKVYSELSQMQGVIFASCFLLSISFCIVVPSAWKSHCGVRGRKRKEQKQSAIDIVNSYGISAPEDACEAILQGKYIIENAKGKKYESDYD